jgi:hypothetical protein
VLGRAAVLALRLGRPLGHSTLRVSRRRAGGPPRSNLIKTSDDWMTQSPDALPEFKDKSVMLTDAATSGSAVRKALAAEATDCTARLSRKMSSDVTAAALAAAFAALAAVLAAGPRLLLVTIRTRREPMVASASLHGGCLGIECYLRAAPGARAL